MGAGSSKTHQPFLVSPAVSDGPNAVATPAAAGGLALPAPPAPPIPPSTGPAQGGPAAPAPAPAGTHPAPATSTVPDNPSTPQPDPPAAGAAVPSVDLTAGPPGALTPVPDTAPYGQATGVGLLVGGADLDDSTVTLVAYAPPTGQQPDQAHEALLATVTDAAEDKLLESLSLSTEVAPVTVTEPVTGRLPLDQTHQLHEHLEKVAKSVNHHLKHGDGIPDHTRQNLTALRAQLDQVVADPTLTDTEKAMAGHYLDGCAQLTARIDGSVTAGYADGGKVPHLSPYTVNGPVAITKYLPVPQTDGAGHPTALRDAGRIKAHLGDDGIASWDGVSRRPGNGKEYIADLGGGYTAVYRPRAGQDAGNVDYSQRGSLELHAPTGVGHGPELVRRLGQLNLVNRPLTRQEGEWTYLTRNVAAQRLDQHPAVVQAMTAVDGLTDAMQHKLFGEHAHAAAGLDAAGLSQLAQRLCLEAQAQSLPIKVRVLRDAVATATGHTNGAALAASPGYRPEPASNGGRLTWHRFDVDANPLPVRDAFTTRGLAHTITAGNLVEVIRSGHLLSNERRAVAGIARGLGMSEGADQQSGGARSVFLRVGHQPTHGPALHWADPTVLLRRSDWYGADSDTYGAINPKNPHYNPAKITRDPAKVAAFHSPRNEVMFANGIDLLGAEAPTLIRCRNNAERQQILSALAARGISTLGGRPVTDVVQS